MFLTKEGEVKIGDLNVSKLAKNGLLYTQTGTPYYASPEVWRDKPYDIKSDIWSLGCVIYEAASLHPPFRAADMQSLFKRVTAGVYPDIPMQYSSDLAAVIKALLQQNPALRPNCSTCVRYPADQIFEMTAVAKHRPLAGPLAVADQVLAEGGVLGTILLPGNLHVLSTRLPKPKSNPSPVLQKYAIELSNIALETLQGLLP
jgi:NIMA (never in mitosis gene a)-related kinase